MSPTTQLRAIALFGLALLAYTVWPPPAPAPDPPPPTPPHRASRPRIEITLPPVELIREPPTRADGLDRVSPCDPIPPRTEPWPVTYFSLQPYASARREELDATLRPATSGALGERLREALSAPAPTNAETEPIDSDAIRFATLTSLSEGARNADRTDVAIGYATEAIGLDRDDPLGWVLVHLAAEDRGDIALARAALVNAYQRAPRDVDIARRTSRVLRRTSDVMGTLAAADAVLDAAADPSAIAFRARVASIAHTFADGVRRSRGLVTVIGTAALDGAAVDRLLDLATDALASAEATFGHPRADELVLYVYPDDARRRAVRCMPGGGDALVGSTDLVLADLDPSTESLLRTHLERLALGRSLPRLPPWLRAAIIERARPDDPGEDRAAYAVLVERARWIRPLPLVGPRADPGSRDARPARAEARALVEWIVARRGESVIAELADSFALLDDPVRRLSEIAGAPLDEPTFLAFLATRVEDARAAP